MAESTENQGHPGLHEDRETRETHEYREDRSRSDSSDRDENRASRERRSSRLGPLPVGYQLRSSRTTFRFASSKLDLIKNPLQQPEAEEGESLITDKDKHRQSLPGQRVNSDELPLQFAKRESASTSELFYDLWFVANLNVFTTVHEITQTHTLVTFIGYFFLLWVTWLITTVFDARFGQDGILERVARACHLTVMIGFAVVGVSFGDEEVIEPIFKATSLFLMFSRLILACQYGMVLFHTRHHRRTRMALTIAIWLHLLPALAYLIAGLAVKAHPDNHITLIWYIVGLMEMLSLIIHAMFSKTLSFEGTHFNERLNLLTLIILGEGVIILAKNITKIVEYTYVKDITDRWSPALIGIIICSAALLYLTFQLYFDWMHHHSVMKAFNQAYWTVVHLPFHIALVLLSEGASQWAVWWRAMESFSEAEGKLLESVEDSIGSEHTSDVVKALQKTTYSILEEYGSDILDGGKDADDLEETFKKLKDNIPDDYWSDTDDSSDKILEMWAEGYAAISSTVINAISDAFDISVIEEEKSTVSAAWDEEEREAVGRTAKRLWLIFIYTFLAAGMVLILLMIMHLVSKRRGWSIFNIFRTALVFSIGLGLSLVALIGTNTNLTIEFLSSPWQLPTITICYLFVLILTHLPHPPRVFIKKSEKAESDMEMGRLSGREIPMEEAERAEPRVAEPPAAEPRAAEPKMTRTMTLKRGLTTMQRTARNIRIEPGRYDPVAEDELFFERRSPISGPNLHRV